MNTAPLRQIPTHGLVMMGITSDFMTHFGKLLINRQVPLSCEFGTIKTVKAINWPWPEPVF